MRSMSRRNLVCALMMALSLCTGAQAQQAIKAGDVLTGTLRLVNTSHPNGTRIHAYQIVSAPRMMPAGDDFCDDKNGATTFHLVTMQDAQRKQLKPLLGKTIRVKAIGLHCSETAWHIGDAVVGEWALQGKR
jgi:hypothetical protein